MANITLQDLSGYLDVLLESSSFSDYGPNGIQVEGVYEIARVGTAVTASFETIERAIKAGVQALIVHHGMFWNRDPYPIVGIKRKKLELLLKHHISLLAYHLPLDAHRLYGNNWRAAIELGWVNLEPVFVEGLAIGVMGEFSEQTREHFKQSLEAYYDHQAHHVDGGGKMVRSAAIISGGAYKFIPEVARLGVDSFITGNYDEPAWHNALEYGLNFYAMGHSATEKIGPKALGEHLAEKFGLDVRFIDVYNPF